MSLKFTLSENNQVLKEFNVETPSLEEYSEYRKSLKLLQKSVNEYLTSLVTEEAKLAVEEEEKEEFSSDSDSEQRSPKRSLSDDRDPKNVKVRRT